jgi:redox-sensitive bicupin YhaK (pirin superfamily)
MTAGAGVVHSELPEDELVRSGGRMHGFQLWVNLPQRDKMIHPRYQDVQSAEIPVVRTADGSVAVKVIAGEALGARAVIDTHTPIMYLHFTLQPGASITQPVPVEFNVFAYVFRGKGRFGDDPDGRQAGQMIAFAADGDSIVITADPAGTEPMDVLLIGGEPLREPVARYGPFVMNTFDEIRQAFADYRDGRLGKIDF